MNDAFQDNVIRIGQEKTERYNKLFREKLKDAKQEEDIRLATYDFLKELTKEMGVNIKIKNEVIVLTGGRIDSLFDNIMFEFKKYDLFRTKGGTNEATYGRKNKGGLLEYLLSVALSESNDLDEMRKYLSTKIGIGFDGNSFIFVRYVYNVNNEIDIKFFTDRLKTKGKIIPNWLKDYLDGYFEITDTKDITTGLRFLFLYLRSISPREPLTPKNVSLRFGEQSTHFQKHIGILYELLTKKLSEKESHVETLFGEWNRVFGKVYGDVNTVTSDVKEKLAEKYKTTLDLNDLNQLDFKLLIFVIHSYYNIILKLLVSELFSSLLNPFSNRKTVLALNDISFKSYLKKTIDGESFKTLGVENFFETGFFEWWIYAWNGKMSEMLREVISLLEEMEVTTSITKPELISDMVKRTYHSLMPQGLRHLLGEYFTPDWLAEYAVETSGYSGKINETFLDPACGSGTFLTVAIRKKILENKKIERKELVKNILTTIVGFDLNPISVIASKTNYLLSIGDIQELDFVIKIPVYQCDSILTPAVHASQKKNTPVFKITGTVCGDFEIPALENRDEIEDVLDIIGVAIKDKFTDSDFIEKIKLKYKNIDKNTLLKLYVKIKELNKKERDGFWVPILKNSFAPVYSENEFDYIVGNPPWVSWRSMSKSYRDLTLPIWLSYNIFDKSAYDKRTTHDDFAMAFTYVSADHYLKKKGKLCFVISQAFFKSSKGGEGFRKFELTKESLQNRSIPIKVHRVTDMVDVKPFKEVTNRTAVLLLEKDAKTTYPVPYIKWMPTEKVNEEDTLLEVKRKIKEILMVAIPIGGLKTEKGRRSPWLTLPESKIKNLSKIIGDSSYNGRKGVEPLGAKGVYVLKEPNIVKGGRVQICNNLDRGRLKEIKDIGEHIGLINDTFVFPMISGRNIDRYGINSYAYILLPHENKRGPHNAIPEKELRVKYTSTYEWLYYFKKILFETRERNSKFFDKKIDPFYALDNVGIYTFAPYKVVWREQNKRMISCVISTKQTDILKGKLIIPDSKVLFCPLANKNEAHYVCAVLNSKPVTDIIEGYTLELQRGIDIFDNIKIPQFNPKNKLHSRLSELSQKAHDLYQKNENISGIQKEIDTIVFDIF